MLSLMKDASCKSPVGRPERETEETIGNKLREELGGTSASLSHFNETTSNFRRDIKRKICPLAFWTGEMKRHQVKRAVARMCFTPVYNLRVSVEALLSPAPEVKISPSTAGRGENPKRKENLPSWRRPLLIEEQLLLIDDGCLYWV
jgi:hypothetical protein